MALFNTPVAALLLSLTLIAALSPASAYRSATKTPAPSPPFEGPYSYNVIPMGEQETDSRYLTAHMNAAVSKVELFLASDVESKLKEAEAGGYDKECMAMCKEMYQSAAESMKRGVESVDSGDFIKAAFDVSAFNTDVDTCNDCSDAFDGFDRWAKGVAGDCLDKIIRHTTPF